MTRYRVLAAAAFVTSVGLLAAYLAAMAWFGWTAFQLLWTALALDDSNRGLAGGLAAVLALGLVAALTPRRSSPRLDDIAVTEAEHPALFAAVQQVARTVGVPRPARIRVTATAEVEVTVRPRTLWLGLGLVAGLDRRALEATIARALVLLRHRASWARRSVALVEYAHRWPWMRGLSLLARGPARLGRALDRDAERDADRIATALAGSDEDARRRRVIALGHHLTRARTFAIHEASRGRPIADLFAVQARFAARWPAIVGASDDARGEPAWELFTEAAALRAQVTARGLTRPQRDATLAAVALDDTLARLDAALDRPHLAPRYRGLYAEPGVTRLPMSVTPPPVDDPSTAIEALYPPELVDELADPAILAKELVAAREGRARMAHQQLAASLLPAWVDAVRSRGRLVHWAEHAAADLDDLATTTRGTGVRLPLAVLFAATDDLTRRLARLEASLDGVRIPSDIQARLDTWPWSFADTTPFGGGVRVDEVGWRATRAVAALEDLRAAALDSLLAVEDRIAELAAAGDPTATAPEPARTPERYPQHVRAVTVAPRRTWREPARTAGFAAITAAAVAGTAIAAGYLRKVEVAAYNGTGGPVVVTIDGERRTVPPSGHARFRVVAGRVAVSTRTPDGDEVEAFHERIDERHRYVYDVATALPLLEETVLYAQYKTSADVPDSRVMPLRRWHAVTIDWLFVTPPKTKQVEEGRTKTFTMVSAILPEQEHPTAALGILDRFEDAERVVEAQLRWRPSTARYAAAWWSAGAEFGGFSGLLARRLTRNPDDPLLRTVEQDHAGERHAAVCAEHRTRAAAHPDDPSWQYLAARCLDPEARSAAMDAALQRWPDASWLLLGAGQAAAALDDLAKAERLLNKACFSLAHHCDAFAIDIARARRALGSDPFAGLPIGGGPYDYLVAPHADAWWLKLRRGELALAVEAADTIEDPRDGQRARWLAAASDDAAPSFLADAEAAFESGDLNDPALALVIYALRSRAGRAAPTDLDEAVNAAVADSGVDAAHDAAALRGFVTLLTTDSGAHVETAEAALTPIAPVLRGRAYVAAAILLGPRCPPRWRTLAQQLLFDHERPWFKPT